MHLTSDDSRHDLLDAADDRLHEPADHWWYTETWWFWWFVPEERIAGWLYHYVRPTIGTSQGGVWVWDDRATSHFEVPYWSSHTNLRMRDQDDPAVVRFPSGAAVETVEPLTRYRLTYADDPRIRLSLDFDATMPPWVDARRATHLDQFGRVRGTMTLHGRAFEIDCHAIRDRSWELRTERWVTGGHGYCTAAGDEVAMLATSPLEVARPDTAPVTGGFFVRDGVRAGIAEGERTVRRDPEHGYVREVTIEADDTSGRRFRATGTALNRIAMPVPGMHGVAWTSLVDWRIDGVRAWGDDQDCWSANDWSSLYRRRTLAIAQGG